MRRIILIMMAFFLIQGKALAIEWPQDFPTIEALISLHKLDSKLSNGYSYVLLAASLSYTASSMYKLIQEYSEFAQLSVQYSTKKPMVAWYFAEANLACSREIKNIKALYLTMTASGLNVMKASMDEKLNLVNSIKTSIDTMRGIIDSAYCWASIVAVGGFHYDYIWDILNSEVTDEIATGLINQWNKV